MNILIKYTEFLVQNLIRKNLKYTKIIDFLRSQRINVKDTISKVEAEEELKKILYDDQVIDAFCNKFKFELALLPIELEVLLGCKRSERLRWTKEKKLPIVYFKDVYKFGAHLMCPFHMGL